MVIPAQRLREKIPGMGSDLRNAIAVYDFRASADGENSIPIESIRGMLKDIGKHWVFQKERSDSGYLHWQGRVSLVKKRRPAELVKIWATMTTCRMPQYFKPTTTNETFAKSFSYVMKSDTRVEGPWADTDVEVYVPRQYRGLLERMWPWQQTVWDSAKDFHDRRVNVIYCEHGSTGKSSLAALCALYGKGLIVPPIHDADKLVQSVHCMCADRKIRDPSPVIIDMPRSMDQTKMGSIYAAIEQIKNGRLYDVRNHFAEWWIDSPAVWVFTNSRPKLSYLSENRWAVWQIENKILCKYTPLLEANINAGNETIPDGSSNSCTTVT